MSHTALVCFHRQCPLELAVEMNPVVSQPGYGAGYGAGGVMNSDWQTGVFDCCDDLGICKSSLSSPAAGTQAPDLIKLVCFSCHRAPTLWPTRSHKLQAMGGFSHQMCFVCPVHDELASCGNLKIPGNTSKSDFTHTERSGFPI